MGNQVYNSLFLGMPIGFLLGVLIFMQMGGAFGFVIGTTISIAIPLVAVIYGCELDARRLRSRRKCPPQSAPGMSVIKRVFIWIGVGVAGLAWCIIFIVVLTAIIGVSFDHEPAVAREMLDLNEANDINRTITQGFRAEGAFVTSAYIKKRGCRGGPNPANVSPTIS